LDASSPLAECTWPWMQHHSTSAGSGPGSGTKGRQGLIDRWQRPSLPCVARAAMLPSMSILHWQCGLGSCPPSSIGGLHFSSIKQTQAAGRCSLGNKLLLAASTSSWVRCITAAGGAPIVARHAQNAPGALRAGYLHALCSHFASQAKATAAAHNSSGQRFLQGPVEHIAAPAQAWP
jgi:hypothetical protein